MGKLGMIKNVVLIVIIVGMVFLFGNYAEPVKNMVFKTLHIPTNDVLGASSTRAEEFTQKVGSDIGVQAKAIEKQILNIKVSDMFGVLGRAQRIPQDIKAAGDFIKDQADNVLQSKK